MRKTLVALAAILLATLGMAGTASAQDAVLGTVTADPAQVPEAGEYTMTATGADFIPDTSILLVKCVSPAATLVPGVSTQEDVVAAGTAISPLADCDIAAAQNVDVDSDGNWSAELTAEVGDNFFLSAGALDGSQAGATWVPIIGDAPAAEEEAAEEEPAEEAAEEEAPAEEEEAAEAEESSEALADTGVETGLLAVVGTAVLGAGVLIAREGRRLKN